MMKYLNFAAICSCLFFSVSSSFKGPALYQVISSHPHDLEEMAPFVKTVKESGRLHIVSISEDTPDDILKNLKPITGKEKSYRYKRSLNLKKETKIDIDPLIKKTVSEVNLKRIENDVAALVAFKTRHSSSKENRLVTVELEQKLMRMGFSVSRDCFGAGVCNLVAEKVGVKNPDQVLAVVAHMDSVGHDFAGADDNASGVSALLEMAFVLKNISLNKTIRFILTNAEEQGLLGSRHYLAGLSQSDISEFELVINMDMVGYNSNGIVELETNPNLENLAKYFANLAENYTTLKSKITLGAWGSDHVPFLDAGINAILTLEDWETKTPCYHKACDKIESLNFNYAAEVVKLNIAAIMSFDSKTSSLDALEL